MRRLLTTAALAITATALAAPAAHAADTCSNAQYRKGAAANLADCRAWEQVTPNEKGGRQPEVSNPSYPSPDGNRLLLFSRANIAGANGEGAPFVGVFSSLRGLDWATFGVDPPVDSVSDTFTTTYLTRGLSDDRSKALSVSLRQITPDAVEGASNVYARDTTDRSTRLLVSLPGRAFYDSWVNAASVFSYAGGSSDLSRAVIQSPLALAPGALDLSSGAKVNTYLVGDGKISLVSRDLNDDPIAVDAVVSSPRRVSTDGRRILYFAQTGVAFALYQRVDGQSTVLISRSHQDGASPNTPEPVPLGGAWPSADGTQVTFAPAEVTAATPSLVKDGPGPFYRWSANGDELQSLLTDVTVPWSPRAINFRIQNVSPDGRYVWFSYTERDANDVKANRFSVLDTDRKTVSIKASFDGDNANDDLTILRFSADGSKLGAATTANLTGYDQAGPACVQNGGRCSEAYYFDAERDDAAPVCISCGPSGTESAGEVNLGGFPDLGYPQPETTANTGTVVFDTPQRLVSADVNSLSDVYQYTPGRGVSLVSSGTGSHPAVSVATTPSGRDIFFRTIDPLVPQDTNVDLDIYDARAAGGIATQQVAPANPDRCPTADCAGPLSAAPAAQAPGTSTFEASPRPPAFGVARVSAAARRVAARTGRMALAVRVGAAGRLSARASRRASTVGRASLTVRRGGRYTLTLTLSKAARRALTRERSLALSVTVAYSRAAEPARQAVKLFAPRSSRSAKGGGR